MLWFDNKSFAFASAVVVIVGWMPGACEANMAALESAASALKPHLVRIRTSFPECKEKRDAFGWGFVVGEDTSNVFIGAPDHLFLRDEVPGPACRPVQTLFSFQQEQATRERNLDYRAVVVTAAGFRNTADFAFFKVPKPIGWRSTPPITFQAPNSTRGATVSYLGYKQRPTIPLDSGRVLDACHREKADGPCTLTVEDLVSVEGNSGAVLFATSGEILGFLLTQDGGRTISALRVDEVRRISERFGVPWTLYTLDEQAKLGADLNAAIRNADVTGIERTLSRYFNIDVEYGNGPDSSKVFPIVLAARSKRFDLVKRMIERGVRNTAVAGRLATSVGEVEVAQLLVDKKHDIGCSLATAIQDGQNAIAARILQSRLAGKTYDINEICAADMTPLFWAIKKGEESLALEILAQGADPNRGHIDRVYIRGYPLTAAILAMQNRLVDRLIELGAKVDAIEYPSDLRPSSLRLFDIFGPVHAAAYIGNIQLLEKLIGKGAKPDAHVTTSEGSRVVGGSPFEAAVLNGQMELAHYLRSRYGVSPIGYRYIDTFVENIRTSALSPKIRLDAERYIQTEKATYCKNLRENQFSTKSDFVNQQARCF